MMESGLTLVQLRWHFWVEQRDNPAVIPGLCPSTTRSVIIPEVTIWGKTSGFWAAEHGAGELSTVYRRSRVLTTQRSQLQVLGRR
jgi:hypothetical protein